MTKFCNLPKTYNYFKGLEQSIFSMCQELHKSNQVVKVNEMQTDNLMRVYYKLFTSLTEIQIYMLL